MRYNDKKQSVFHTHLDTGSQQKSTLLVETLNEDIITCRTHRTLENIEFAYQCKKDKI